MLIALMLGLTTEKPATLPPYLGRANSAATLDRLRTLDAGLAAQIHAGNGPKPITCSGLLNARADRDGSRTSSRATPILCASPV